MGTRSTVWTRRTQNTTRRYGHSVMNCYASFHRAFPRTVLGLLVLNVTLTDVLQLFVGASVSGSLWRVESFPVICFINRYQCGLTRTRVVLVLLYITTHHMALHDITCHLDYITSFTSHVIYITCHYMTSHVI